MSAAAHLLQTARAAGLSLAASGDNLVIETDIDPPPELLAELRERKAELIALLARIDRQPPETQAGDILADAVLLRDGRRFYKFHASEIPSAVPRHVTNLVEAARFHRVVLVADGHDLVVVEPWLSDVEFETIAALKSQAGAVIAALRGEVTGTEGSPP